MMDYRNDKLNITIQSNVFTIKEYENYVGLYDGSLLRFRVFDNSTVEAYDNSRVRAYGNSAVEAYNNSTVEAYGNSTVRAYNYSTVRAYDNSTVRAYGSSAVEAYGNSTVIACNRSKVTACDNSTVEACDNSTVEAYDNSTVRACDNSTVRAYDNSTVRAYGSSTVIACNHSKVTACDTSTVEAYGNSTVIACEFSCVYIKSSNLNISTKNHFGTIIKQIFKTTKKTLVYKKLNNNLIATLQLEKGQIFQSENHDKCRTDRALVVAIESIDKTQSYQRGVSQRNMIFKYIVGQVVSAEYDKNIKECSTGIHFFLTREKAENY